MFINKDHNYMAQWENRRAHVARYTLVLNILFVSGERAYSLSSMPLETSECWDISTSESVLCICVDYVAYFEYIVEDKVESDTIY